MSATATQQACATPTSMPRAALPLEDAEAEVLAWFPSRVEPRIGTSGYVHSADIPSHLGEVWPREWLLPGDIAILGDLVISDAERTSPCRLLAFATASFGNIPRYQLSFDAVEPGALASYPREDGHRSQVFALFDAESGELLGALDDAWNTERLDWVPDLLEIVREDIELESRLVTVDGPADRLAERGPMPRPETALRPPSGPGHALSRGEVPDALLPIAEVFPLVVGSRWTYRQTTIDNRVFWSEQVITDTIESAWLTEDGALESWASRPSAGWEGRSRRLIDEGGAYWHGFEEADLPWPLRLDDVRGEPRGDFETNIVARGAITLPAGHFEDCYGLTRQLGLCMGEEGWFCSGVGWVWRLQWGCSSLYDNLVIDELLDYEIPEIRGLTPGE